MQNITANETFTDPTQLHLEKAATILWIIFSPIFLFVGIFGNGLNIFVLRKMRFQKNPTLILLFVLSLTDMAVLINGLTRYWLLNAFDYDLRLVSTFSCKLSFFLLYSTMQLSSWILVLVSIIRVIKTVIPLRYTKTKMRVSRKNTLTALGIVIIALAAINLHFFFTNGVYLDKGSFKCGSLTEDFHYFDEFVFVYIDLMVLSIIPAIIIIVCNICIYYVLANLKKRRSSSSSTDQMTQESVSKVTKMLFVTSTYFVISSLPISVHFIVDSYVRPDASDLVVAKLDIAWTVFYLLQFSHFVVNFYFYTATNKRFRKHIKNIRMGLQNKMRRPSQVVDSYEANSTNDSHSHKKYSFSGVSKSN